MEGEGKAISPSPYLLFCQAALVSGPSYLEKSDLTALLYLGTTDLPFSGHLSTVVTLGVQGQIFAFQGLPGSCRARDRS